MQPLTTIDRVLAGTGPRTISLLTNRQLIELAWDRVVVQMRVTDLLVLDRTLRAWIAADLDADWHADADGDFSPTDFSPTEDRPAWQLLPVDCTQPYILSLNQQCILIKEQELIGFCALVADAVEQLPRRTVRWAELDVQLLPLSKAASVPSPAAHHAAAGTHGTDASQTIAGIPCLCPN